MRSAILILFVAGALACCGQDSNRPEGTSGSGKIYGRGGENQKPQAPPEVRAGADSTATDLRPTGGSMAGAGGAGPGYDGSGHGGGKHGTIPPPGAGFAGSLTNSQDSTHPAGDRTQLQAQQDHGSNQAVQSSSSQNQAPPESGTKPPSTNMQPR